MDMNKEIKETIKRNIAQFQNNIATNKEIFRQETIGNNEFLFFIKPELTLKSNTELFNSILQFILERIEHFDLKISSIRILNAFYLEKHSVIAQHYGVINKLSSHIQQYISPSAKQSFESIYKQSFSTSKVLGSLEFLKVYPHFTATGLSYLWQNSPTEKLGGGAYCQKISLDGETIFLINGFHPRQLEHFIAPGRFIITMNLKGDTDWSIARNQLIGKTNPLDAEKGSIRRELLDRQKEFGLEGVSSSWNGVHLSAGPIEGLIELLRYNSDFETKNISKLTDYKIGIELIAQFGSQKIESLLSNPIIQVDNKQISLFDYSEEMNSSECIKKLKDLTN
jgi:hypothetical protein